MTPRLVLLLAAAVLAAPAAHAQDARLRLEPASLPRPLLDGDKADVVIEASGVEPIGDGRRALVAHDKAPALHVVDLATGRLVGAAITSPRFPPQTKSGPKWEGMARDAEGNFYLVGSHSGKTDAEKAEKSTLLRFRLKDGSGDVPAIDDDSVVRWQIARSLASVLKAAGLDEAKVGKRKIEGLAVRERGGQARAGHRPPRAGRQGPRVRRRHHLDPLARRRAGAEAAIRLRGEAPRGRAGAAHVARIRPRPGGVPPHHRDRGRRQRLPRQHALVRPRRVGRPGRRGRHVRGGDEGRGARRPGIPQGRARTAVKLLITFDNDPHATKIPSRFQTATLVAEPR